MATFEIHGCYMLLQLVLFFKGELFLCLSKVDHVINFCKKTLFNFPRNSYSHGVLAACESTSKKGGTKLLADVNQLRLSCECIFQKFYLGNL